MSGAGHETMHELLFDEQQDLYRPASHKVATTVEGLAAQLDIFILEAADDDICVHPDNDYQGQMMRSVRAGESGLVETKDTPALKAVDASKSLLEANSESPLLRSPIKLITPSPDELPKQWRAEQAGECISLAALWRQSMD